jgi:hypothetical protein
VTELEKTQSGCNLCWFVSPGCTNDWLWGAHTDFAANCRVKTRATLVHVHPIGSMELHHWWQGTGSSNKLGDFSHLRSPHRPLGSQENLRPGSHLFPSEYEWVMHKPSPFWSRWNIIHVVMGPQRTMAMGLSPLHQRRQGKKTQMKVLVVAWNTYHVTLGNARVVLFSHEAKEYNLVSA